MKEKVFEEPYVFAVCDGCNCLFKTEQNKGIVKAYCKSCLKDPLDGFIVKDYNPLQDLTTLWISWNKKQISAEDFTNAFRILFRRSVKEAWEKEIISSYNSP